MKPYFLVEYLGIVDLVRWRKSKATMVPLKEMLEQTPHGRVFEDAEVVNLIDHFCIEARIGQAKALLHKFDSPIWFELLDDRGDRATFYIVIPYYSIPLSSSA